MSHFSLTLFQGKLSLERRNPYIKSGVCVIYTMVSPCIFVTLIMTVAAVFTAYFGRKRGAVKGKENYKADKAAIRDELGVKEKGK